MYHTKYVYNIMEKSINCSWYMQFVFSSTITKLSNKIESMIRLENPKNIITNNDS